MLEYLFGGITFLNTVVLFFIIIRLAVLRKIKNNALKLTNELLNESMQKQDKRRIALKKLFQSLNKCELLFIDIDELEYAIELSWKCVTKRNL